MRVSDIGKQAIVYFRGKPVFFHVLPDDKKLSYHDNRKVVIGRWVKALSRGKPVKTVKLCARGMHASPSLASAHVYKSVRAGKYVCLVELRGVWDIDEVGYPKVVALERKVVAWRVVKSNKTAEKLVSMRSQDAASWVIRSRAKGSKERKRK